MEWHAIVSFEKAALWFEAHQGDIYYTLRYKAAYDHLIVECTISNRGDDVFRPEYSRLFIGVDSEMKTYPDWDTKFFPTLLRCERILLGDILCLHVRSLWESGSKNR